MIGEKDIHDVDPNTGRDTDVVIARTKPASPEAVAYVLAAEENDNGRSEWLWLRLANGDLMLGVFPQGDTYFQNEEEQSF
jgi:hypothetical protein